eukprot:13816629-Alexandrium_andersonii.AAC.1
MPRALLSAAAAVPRVARATAGKGSLPTPRTSSSPDLPARRSAVGKEPATRRVWAMPGLAMRVGWRPRPPPAR